jgi:hypothetical protein
MKKIILAVLIAIIGFTASAQKVDRSEIFENVPLSLAYDVLYEPIYKTVAEHCVGADTRYIKEYFVKYYYVDKKYRTFVKFSDLTILTALQRGNEIELMFKLLDDAATYETDIVTIMAYYTRKNIQ